MPKRPRRRGYVLRHGAFDDCYFAGSKPDGSSNELIWTEDPMMALRDTSRDRMTRLQKMLVRAKKRETKLCQIWVLDQQAAAVAMPGYGRWANKKSLQEDVERDLERFLQTFGVHYYVARNPRMPMQWP